MSISSLRTAFSSASWGAVAIFALVAGLAAVGFAAIDVCTNCAGSTTSISMLITLTTVVSLLPMFVGVRRWSLDPFEPSVIIGAIWILSYVIPSIFVVQETDLTWALWSDRVDDQTMSLLIRAQALALGAIGALMAGYYLYGWRTFERSKPPAKAPVPFGPSFNRYALAFTAVGAAAFLLLAEQVGGIREFINMANDRVRLLEGKNYLAAPIVVVLSVALLWWARTLSEGTRIGFRLALYVIAALSTNVLLASKTNILVMLLAMAVCYHYARRPLRLTALLAIALAAVAIALAMDLLLREYFIQGEFSSLDPGEIVGVSALISLGWLRFSSGTFIQVQTLMLMLGAVPAVLPFQMGKSYVALALMPIPRAVFPTKPPVATEVFSAAVFPDLLENGTSIPTSMIGEWYLNFGPVGVILLSFAAGVALRWCYLEFRRRQRDPLVLACYGSLIGVLFPYVRGDSFGPTVFVVSLVAPMLLLAALSRWAVAASKAAAGYMSRR